MRTSGASISDEADSPKLASLFVEGNAPSLPLCRTGVWKRQSVVFFWSIACGSEPSRNMSRGWSLGALLAVLFG